MLWRKSNLKAGPMNLEESSFLWTQTKEKAGIRHPSHPFLFFTFLFDQVHPKVAIFYKIHWARSSFSWIPVEQKDHNFLPLSIVHDEGFQYSPYDPTSHPQIPAERGSRLFTRKFWEQVTRKIIHWMIYLRSALDQQQLKKSSTSHMTAQYSRFGIMNTSRSKAADRWHRLFDRFKPLMCHLPKIVKIQTLQI